MGFFRRRNTTSTSRTSVIADPTLKFQMMSAYPDLKASELEALTRLTLEDAESAAAYIKRNMADTTFVEFKDKVRKFDPRAAECLDKAA